MRQLTLVGLAVWAVALGCAGRSERTVAGSDGSGASLGSGSAAGGAGGGTSGGSTTGGSGGVPNPEGSSTGGRGGDGAHSGSGAPASGANGGGAGTTDQPGNGLDTTLIPDPSGWVDAADPGNDVGIQGTWFAYGDAYSSPLIDGTCVTVGLHAPSECAQIIEPRPPPALGFPNQGGLMRTTGIRETILECPTGLTTSGCPYRDYAHMWGAGIGFTFNSPGGADAYSTFGVWDPAPYGVVGISFVIDSAADPLRIEFAMVLTDEEAAADYEPLPPGSTTLQHSAGSPYWGAQRGGRRHLFELSGRRRREQGLL